MYVHANAESTSCLEMVDMVLSSSVRMSTSLKRNTDEKYAIHLKYIQGENRCDYAKRNSNEKCQGKDGNKSAAMPNMQALV